MIMNFGKIIILEGEPFEPFDTVITTVIRKEQLKNYLTQFDYKHIGCTVNGSKQCIDCWQWWKVEMH